MMYYRFPSFRANPPSETKTAQEYLAEILSRSESQQKRYTASQKKNMPSSKGKPTDLKLRDEEEVKKESKGIHAPSTS